MATTADRDDADDGLTDAQLHVGLAWAYKIPVSEAPTLRRNMPSGEAEAIARSALNGGGDR